MEFVWSGRWDASARLLVLLVLLAASVLFLSAALLRRHSFTFVM